MTVRELELIELISSEIKSAHVKSHEPMKGHTSLHIGGPADIFLKPQDINALSLARKIISRHGSPSLPLGGGTNLLVMDAGIEGVVISLAGLRGLRVVKETSYSVDIEAEAGFSLQELVGYAKERGFGGIEGLAGIPGQIGGAISGNSGAFGFEIKDVIMNVSVMDALGNIITLSKRDISFAYRKAVIPKDTMVVGALIRLTKDEPKAVADRVRRYFMQKKGSQPLGKWSAGCVFKNPEGHSAGKLMDEVGLKGMKVGDMEISNIHANFFINNGKGTAEDFLRLVDIAATRVRDAFGIILETEVKVVGKR